MVEKYNASGGDALLGEIKDLKEKLTESNKEILSLNRTLQTYGIIDVTEITDIEYICHTQIKELKDSATNGELIKEQVENLDRIVKILNREWSGIKKKEIKSHEKDISKLLKIASNNDNS